MKPLLKRSGTLGKSTLFISEIKQTRKKSIGRVVAGSKLAYVLGAQREGNQEWLGGGGREVGVGGRLNSS